MAPTREQARFYQLIGHWKGKEAADPAFGKDAPAFMPAAGEMDRLAKWAGTYDIQGCDSP